MKTPRRVGATMSFVFAACVAYSAAGATAHEQSTSLASICAEREVQVITLLEDHGRSQDISSDALGEAGLARMQAQTACYQGRVAEAISIYDGIVAKLGPVIVRAAR
jgi:hypothetical protein